MTLEEHLALDYPILILPDVDTAGRRVYFAKHPDLLGCCSHGDTPEQAIANLRDARELWIRTAYEDGVEIPLPSTESAVA